MANMFSYVFHFNASEAVLKLPILLHPPEKKKLQEEIMQQKK